MNLILMNLVLMNLINKLQLSCNVTEGGVRLLQHDIEVKAAPRYIKFSIEILLEI